MTTPTNPAPARKEGGRRRPPASSGGDPGVEASPRTPLVIRALADQHGALPAIEPCDLLLIAGDICPAFDHGLDFQERWLRTVYASWLRSVPARWIVGIAGNHDFVFDSSIRPSSSPRPELPWTYLEDESATVGGLRIAGMPWTPWFNDWAFNAPEGDTEEEFLSAKLRAISTADILVTHGPPYGYGDLTEAGQRVGSRALLAAIDRIGPRLCVFGHIHEDRGVWLRDATTLANVTLVNAAYNAVHEPMTFRLASKPDR